MKPMNQRFLELLREEFYKELSRKTGWGRNEIAIIFDQAVSNSAVKILDELEAVNYTKQIDIEIDPF